MSLDERTLITLRESDPWVFTTDPLCNFAPAEPLTPDSALVVVPHTLVNDTYHPGMLEGGIPAKGAKIVQLARVDASNPRNNGGCD